MEGGARVFLIQENFMFIPLSSSSKIISNLLSPITFTGGKDVSFQPNQKVLHVNKELLHQKCQEAGKKQQRVAQVHVRCQRDTGRAPASQ